MKYIIEDFKEIRLEPIIEIICKDFNLYTKNPGNLSKQLKRIVGLDTKSLILQRYIDYLPMCIFSGKPLDNFVNSKNAIRPYRKEYNDIVKEINQFYNFNMRYTDKFKYNYIDWNYLKSRNYEPIDIYNLIVAAKENNAVKWFSDESYEQEYDFGVIRWGSDEKMKYIEKMLSGNFEKIPYIYSEVGMNFRGLDVKTKIEIKQYIEDNIVNDRAFTTETSKAAYIAKKLKYSDEEIKSFSNKNINYYLNRGYTEAEAKQLISEIQNTNGYRTNIDKYGFINGVAKTKEFVQKRKQTFNSKPDEEINRINKSKDSGSLMWAINKYGDLETAIRERNKLIRCRIKNSNGSVSKESLKCFIPLYKNLRRVYNISKDDIKWGIKGSSEYILDHDGGICSYDFTIKSKKIILEYHGVMFHGKDALRGDTTARDKFKKELAELNGFKYFVIWSDYTQEQKNLIFKRIYAEM